jgi:hypothetical protein
MNVHHHASALNAVPILLTGLCAEYIGFQNRLFAFVGQLLFPAVPKEMTWIASTSGAAVNLRKCVMQVND